MGTSEKIYIPRHTVNPTYKVYDNIVPALDTVTVEKFHNHFRKVRYYMFAYLEGLPGGSELESNISP